MKLILTILMFFTSAPVFSQWCDYSINLDSYVPATVSTVSQTLSHSLSLTRGQNSSDPNCSNYNLYFAKGNANSYQRRAYSGSYSLPYNLYRQSNLSSILKDYGDASSGEYVVGYAPNKHTPYTSTWYVGVPSIYENFETARAGVYTDVLPINIYQV